MVKLSTRPDPRIDALPRLLPVRVIICVASERSDSRAEDRDAKRVHTRDDLLEGEDNLIADSCLGSDVRCSRTDVVHALEDHSELDAGLREDVTLNSPEGVRP